jgi:hypothetical protein
MAISIQLTMLNTKICQPWLTITLDSFYYSYGYAIFTDVRKYGSHWTWRCVQQGLTRDQPDDFGHFDGDL